MQRIAPPVANAGTNQIVSPGTTIILNGSGSYDPNRGGLIVYYRWAQIVGIPVSLDGGIGGSSNTPYPRFAAPLVSFNPNTVLTFSLTVIDNYGFTRTNPSTVSVSISTQQQQLQQQQLQQQQLQQQQLQQQPQPQRQQSNVPLPGGLNAQAPNNAYQSQYPYHPPNTGILTPSPNSPLSPPYFYHYPPYQYPSSQVPGNNNNNKPFALKQGNASIVASNPFNNNNAPLVQTALVPPLPIQTHRVHFLLVLNNNSRLYQQNLILF